MLALALMVATSTASTPLDISSPDPFSYSLDQSIPCPRGSGQDSLLAHTNGGMAIDPSKIPAVASKLSALPKFLSDQTAQLSCPSVGAVVIHHDKVLYEGWAGSSRVNSTHSPPLNNASGFMIASISKTFAIVTLFQARDRGLLPQGLDTPLSDLLPGFSINPPEATADVGEDAQVRSNRPVTLRALAMQVSGLPREIPVTGLPPGTPMSDVESATLRIIANLSQLSPAFSEPHYSNLGLALVGRAVEKAVRTPQGGGFKSWEEYLTSDVLKPLGMLDTGNPSDYVNGSGPRARLIDGVDPPNIHTPVPVNMENDWGGPAGAMHSSIRDMVTWMKFLMDVGAPSERALYAKVLDPATRAEMRNSGFFMGDGLSAVGAGVFETAFSSGRWTSNKLGCVPGYRSALSLVPSLGLAVFGVASSTCDLRGDGDAVAFPITASLIPNVESYLADSDAKAKSGAMPATNVLNDIVGMYCSMNDSTALKISVEEIPLPVNNQTRVPTLVMRPPPGAASYSFVFEYIGSAYKTHGLGATKWKRIMGPEQWLPPTLPGCSPGNFLGRSLDQDLCPISCMRKYGRGSGDIVYFFNETVGPWAGHTRMQDFGGGEWCIRTQNKDASEDF